MSRNTQACRVDAGHLNLLQLLHIKNEFVSTRKCVTFFIVFFSKRYPT